jgi:hypothetical protein
MEVPDKQSAIYNAYLDDGTKVWINLNHVVSAHLIKPEGKDGPRTLRVIMIDRGIYDLINDMTEPYTRWADQFLFALNAFHGQ